MPTESWMLNASHFLVSLVAAQVVAGDTGESGLHLYHASRLIGALVLATVVPLLIDRRARRSSRAPQ